MPEVQQGEIVFTPARLAMRWDCSERHIRNLVNRGELPYFKLGGKLLRIRAEDVEAYECQATASSDSGEALPLSTMTKPESGTVTHLQPRTRAKLSTLRQRFTKN